MRHHPLNTLRASMFVKSSEAERAVRSEQGIESCDGIKLCDNIIGRIVDIKHLGFPDEIVDKVGGDSDPCTVQDWGTGHHRLDTIESISLCEIVRSRANSRRLKR